MPGPATSTADRTEPTVADLADDFVLAVCRPEDVEAARATVRGLDPVDLAGLVAAVDDHQPMTLEVAVDVLAELDVAPATIAAAVGVDHEDVQVLLGAPLGGPPPPLADRDARIIEVVASRGDESADPAPSVGDAPDHEPDVAGARVAQARDADGSSVRIVDDAVTDVADDPRDASVAAAAPSGDAAAGSADDIVGHGDAVPPADVTPVIESGGDVDESTGQPSSAATPASRGRVAWAVVLFALLIGGMIALAALLGAF